MIDRRLSVAPMLDWTDRHCRYFHRQLTRRTLLYTEMITTGALIHGDTARFLDYHPDEHPLALQLGGSDPQEMAAAAHIAERLGYDEIKTHLLQAEETIRSRTVEGVEQELWGILLAYNLIRKVIATAAAAHG